MKAAEAYRLIATVPVATLATLRPDGSPHLVPIVFAVFGERIITAIDGKPKQPVTPGRLLNIGADPRVSILVHYYDDDWSRLWWVRIDGNARVLDEGDEYSQGLTTLRKRYSQYESTPLPGPVIVVDPTAVIGWSA
ncbi:MAG TPA: TIGR03668 family PPOX class F420-dependent oxidoreductase [Acidimicrobiia bacterium]|nr:TIGR03668 family PPOX class F420-dependent oxidoreductase [Acidimicrobiia bacterium]